MAKKIKDMVFLTRPEIVLIHYIASKPELLSKIGLTCAQIEEGVTYHMTVVKQTLGDLVILGLAKQSTVEKEGPGRKSHLYTFYHPSLVKLSRHYNNIDNFTMREEERCVAPLVMELLTKGTMLMGDALTFTNYPNLDQVVVRNKELFTRTGYYPTLTYGLTDKGKLWAAELIKIQSIVQKCILFYINKT